MFSDGLTDATVGPCDQHHPVGQVAPVQHLQSRGVPVVALGLHLHVLHGEGLPRVEIRPALVDVTDERHDKTQVYVEMHYIV